MFLLSVLPAFVVLFIRAAVPESPAFEASRAHEKPHLWATITEHKGLVIYMVVLMMCFNLFSHGTQDLYPTFLQKQLKFDPGTVSWITIVANLGAIAGGLTFGHLSERIGRVNAITLAAVIALPALPLWAFSSTPALLALGAFVMQIAVQGAWGVVPAHLNELSPSAARATIPAFVYQAGNFLASYNAPFQARIAEANGGNYAYALALVAGVVAVSDDRRHPLQPGAARRAFDGALRNRHRWPIQVDAAIQSRRHRRVSGRAPIPICSRLRKRWIAALRSR